MKKQYYIWIFLILAGTLFILPGCRDWEVEPETIEEEEEGNPHFKNVIIYRNAPYSCEISWRWHTTSENIEIRNFKIYRQIDDEASLLIATLAPNLRKYIDTAINTFEHDYYYTIHAFSDSSLISSTFIDYDFSCGSASYTDPRDGTTYQTVSDGYRCWFAENLRYLPEVYPANDFTMDSKRYYVYDYDGYDTSAAKIHPNYQSYGVLYNLAAIENACPEEDGWRVATKDDWNTLINVAGFQKIAGGALKENDTIYWNAPNTGATNEYRFNARAGGKLDGTELFFERGVSANFWATPAETYSLHFNSTIASIVHDTLFQANSIRCIKDD